MSSSPPRAITPQTPPENVIAGLLDGPATPTLSPPVSPSMNFRSLGMSPFSSLRRQFSAPFSKSASPQESQLDGSEDQGRTQDSKDVLIQRLNDLVSRLSAAEDLREEEVDSLHAKVDEIEKAVSESKVSSTQRHRRDRSSISSHRDLDVFSGPASPDWIRSHLSEMTLAMASSVGSRPAAQDQKEKDFAEKKVQDERSKFAEQVLTEAQRLEKELSVTVKSLQARLEEQNHIQEMLVTRAERAARRIMHLEKQIQSFEKTQKDGDMELLNLQIQLKAIEVRCLSYVPEESDPEIMTSIERWKIEWSALKRKRAQLLAGDSPSVQSPYTPSVLRKR